MKISRFPAIACVFILLAPEKAVAQQRPVKPASKAPSHPQCKTIPRYKAPSFSSKCVGRTHCPDEFPADPAWLSSASKSNLQNHAWYLYSNIIQPASAGDLTPQWRTWYNECDAFPDTPDACKGQTKVNGIPTILRTPVELKGLFGSHSKGTAYFLSSPFGRISQEILFSEEAWCTVCTRGLGNPAILNSLRKASLAKPPPHFVGAFDRNPKAIVVKAFWLDITPAERRIPYMNDYPSPPLGHDGCINWECWDTKVEVDPDPNKACEAPTSDRPVVSLKCFYGYPIPRFNSTRVLLGLHIITHEANSWVWSTFWWHPLRPAVSGPQQSPNALPLGDSHGIQPPWTDYWMDTTLTSDTRTYNPYLEGAKDNGTYSNCLVCHGKAVYFGDGRPLDDGVGEAPIGYFKDGIQTDYLWSVADNAVRSKPKTGKLKEPIPAPHR